MMIGLVSVVAPLAWQAADSSGSAATDTATTTWVNLTENPFLGPRVRDQSNVDTPSGARMALPPCQWGYPMVKRDRVGGCVVTHSETAAFVTSL